MNVRKQRYRNIFDEMGEHWKAVVDSRDIEKEVKFIESVLPDHRLTLDLCCGTGRHSLNLRKRERNIVGLDISKKLLAIAKRDMNNNEAYYPLIRADMRYFPFRHSIFGGIICMFTSFGYLPSEGEDIKSFREVNRTLQEKGQFLLDVANRDHLIQIFHENEWAEFDGFYLLEKRCLDRQASRLSSQWTVLEKKTGNAKVFHHDLRLYTLEKMSRMLSKAGLKIKRLHGNYDGRGFGRESSRMIILAEKT